MGIHVTTFRHTEFRQHKKSGPKQQLVDIMGYIPFSPKTQPTYVSFKQEGMNYCTTHKYIKEHRGSQGRPKGP